MICLANPQKMQPIEVERRQYWFGSVSGFPKILVNCTGMIFEGSLVESWSYWKICHQFFVLIVLRSNLMPHKLADQIFEPYETFKRGEPGHQAFGGLLSQLSLKSRKDIQRILSKG